MAYAVLLVGVAACLGLALVFSAPGQFLLSAAAQTALPTPGAAAFPPPPTTSRFATWYVDHDCIMVRIQPLE